MTKVSDEMLMAYADGELDAAAAGDIRRAVAADPELARRLDLFARTRREAKAALGPVLEEPVPEAILVAIRSSEPHQRWRWFSERIWVPVGATAALALIGGFLIGVNLQGVGTPPFAIPAEDIADILDETPSGQVVRSGGNEIEIAGTYETGEGYCRVFRMASPEAGWRGVACRREGRWSTELIVADGQAAGDFAPASDHAVQSIEAFLDASGAGGALGEAEERDALGRGWSRDPAETE